MEPMKVKDLIDLLKTKNPEENVIEACVSIAEYFILSSHQHIGFEYKKEFTSFYDAIEEYITTLNKYVVKHGEKSNVDFFITRMGLIFMVKVFVKLFLVWLCVKELLFHNTGVMQLSKR